MRAMLVHGLEETSVALDKLRRDERAAKALEEVALCCVRTLRSHHKLLLAGNGGSAAAAQHWAAELVGRFSYDRPALPAIALTTDTSVLTAIGNDYGYEHTFARQVEALGQAGDVFIGISTSGNSANVLRALVTARDRGVVTVGFTGPSGGRMMSLCDHILCVPGESTPVVQQLHSLLGHVLCEYIEAQLFPRSQANHAS